MTNRELIIKQRTEIIENAWRRPGPFFYTTAELDFLIKSQAWLDKIN